MADLAAWLKYAEVKHDDQLVVLVREAMGGDTDAIAHLDLLDRLALEEEDKLCGGPWDLWCL